MAGENLSDNPNEDGLGAVSVNAEQKTQTCVKTYNEEAEYGKTKVVPREKRPFRGVFVLKRWIKWKIKESTILQLQ